MSEHVCSHKSEKEFIMEIMVKLIGYVEKQNIESEKEKVILLSSLLNNLVVNMVHGFSNHDKPESFPFNLIAMTREILAIGATFGCEDCNHE